MPRYALCRPVCDAVSRYAAECVGGDQEYFMPRNLLIDTRQLAANLIGAEMREVALVGPTSLGLSFIAQGIDWQRGDNIIVHGDDYPSNVYPWMALEEKGVELRHSPPHEPGPHRPRGCVLIDRSANARAACVSPLRLWLPGSTSTRSAANCTRRAGARGRHPDGGARLRGLTCRFSCRRTRTSGCSAPAPPASSTSKRKRRINLPVVQGWYALPGFYRAGNAGLQTGQPRYEAGTANLLGIVGHRHHWRCSTRWRQHRRRSTGQRQPARPGAVGQGLRSDAPRGASGQRQ